MDFSRYINFKTQATKNISNVILGKEEAIELILISFICGGHVLLEDIPGVGKTTMVKAFARTIEKGFKRIQFTPDLLPSDLTGINFYNQKTSEFEFRRGPLFSSIILADEINRATPRTQSSLLEAMEERQITVDGDTRGIDEDFMVLATQNPVESYGTFPLPEAQLDRFFMRIKMGYPKPEEEVQIISKNIGTETISRLKPVFSEQEIKYLKNNYKDILVSEDVSSYIMSIVSYTREDNSLQLGVSPRGTIALFRGSQVKAAFEGRDYVMPEDVKYLARYILNHRIIYKNINRTSGMYGYIDDLLTKIEVPVEKI